jgi:hypothetical protein
MCDNFVFDLYGTPGRYKDGRRKPRGLEEAFFTLESMDIKKAAKILGFTI